MIKCADKKKYQQLFLSPLKTKATYTEFFDIFSSFMRFDSCDGFKDNLTVSSLCDLVTL